jgi:hypothetical protein
LNQSLVLGQQSPANGSHEIDDCVCHKACKHQVGIIMLFTESGASSGGIGKVSATPRMKALAPVTNRNTTNEAIWAPDITPATPPFDPIMAAMGAGVNLKEASAASD